MPATEPAELAELAARLAACVREAGALALSMFGAPLKSWTKGASSPVSEADIAVDKLLHDGLKAVAPDIAWLSEETTDDPVRLDAPRVWIVDPIDGTRGYIAGQTDWAVSAALVESGRPIAACLFAPVTDEFFMAVAGSGATRNGAAIATSPGADLAGVRFAGPKNFLERLGTMAPPFTITPRLHSLALRLARVAQGEIDAAIAGGNSHDWDLAAADLLVHEAGGALTPFGGEPLCYNRLVPRHGMLVAAGRERHAALLELLKRVPASDEAGRTARDRLMSEPAARSQTKQLLHLVFGGELENLAGHTFKDLDKLDIVGIYPNYASAYAAWKAKAQGTVDNAHMRYFIVHLHRLLDPAGVDPRH